VLIASGILPLVLLVPAAQSSTSIDFNFNTAGQLTSEFNAFQAAGTNITQSATGGIGNSGAIYAGSSASAVFATKSTYSLGATGSTYEFSAYLKSVFNSGYSGMGFTSVNNPSTGTNNVGGITRPSDALGISVHGGGFIFHAGSSDYSGAWGQTSSGAIVAVKSSTIGDLLNSGSADKWYLTKLKIERLADNKFKMRVEVWSANADGSLIRPNEADAIFEITNLSNSTITSAPSISSYVSFSGSRVEYFDGFSVNLTGSTVIQSGTPVVLTSSVSESGGVVTGNGNVTSTGGASVTERGFVYGTSANPTISNTKVVVDSGTGTFTGTFSPGAGTHYVRAFATNSNGTSYGTQSQVTIAGPATYTVSFDANGATSGSAPSNQTKTAGSSLTLASNSGNLQKTGFTFAGWNTADDGTGTNYAEGASYTTDAGLTLYAKWAAVFTITYNGNGSTGGSVPTAQTGSGSVTLSGNSGSLVRSGYSFVGWGTTQADTTALSSSYNLTSNVTLYAVWTEVNATPIPYSGPIVTEFSRRELAASREAEVVIDGIRLSSVEEFWMDGKKLPFTRLLDGRIKLSIPSLTAGTYDLKLVHSNNGILTHQDAFQVLRQSNPDLKILKTITFGGNSARLTPTNQRTLLGLLSSEKSVKRVICTGSTSGSRVTPLDRTLALSRARVACDAVRRAMPEVSIELRTNPSSGIGPSFRIATIKVDTK
jgi:uncharacterized repeat protein (TIGR02543 family)